MAERATASVVEATTTLEHVTARPAGALSLVRSRYAELPRALRRVAETVLLDPPAAAEGTVVELAKRSSTSTSTVNRFCHAMGFEGFAGLRLGLRATVAHRAQGPAMSPNSLVQLGIRS